MSDVKTPIMAPAALLEIVKYPDPRLREVCKPVEEFETEELLSQIKGMVEAMWIYGGIGIAANQVGYDNRVIVVAREPSSMPNTTPLVLINPVMRERSSGKQTINEGCLSFPSKTNRRTRSKNCRVVAYNFEGERFTWKFRGLASQVIQHEMDHLNGKTFLDK